MAAEERLHALRAECIDQRMAMTTYHGSITLYVRFVLFILESEAYPGINMTTEVMDTNNRVPFQEIRNEDLEPRQIQIGPQEEADLYNLTDDATEELEGMPPKLLANANEKQQRIRKRPPRK